MGVPRFSVYLTLIVATVAATAGGARAYSYESVVSDGCHERLMMDAWREARDVTGLQAPIVTTRDDDALVRDVPFSLDRDLRDLASVSLLIGGRDPDVKGRHGIDSTELATVHGDPDGQKEHCLRRDGHDGEEGSRLALEECHEHIRALAYNAIDAGLDAEGFPDGDRRTIVPVHLAIGGRVNAPLPIFYVYMGQALHALQDSFTHAFRDPDDHLEVTVVLNWVDFAEDGLRERRDGPPHMVGLDQCVGTDAFLTERRGVARDASVELLMATIVDPSDSFDPEARKAEVDRVLTRYLSFHPGCNADNRWCDAPENRYRAKTECGCRTVGRGGGDASVLFLLFVVALGVRRRWFRAPLFVVGLLLAAATPALAQDAEAEAVPAPPVAAPVDEGTVSQACPPGRQVACACGGGVDGYQVCAPDGASYGECTGCPTETVPVEPVPEAPPAALPVEPRLVIEPPHNGSPFGLAVAAGGAIDNTALAASVGLRYRVGDEWLIGLDGEFNPWASFESKRFSLGVLNFYGVAVKRFPINSWTSLRSKVGVGISVLLFDLFGAPAGSMGVYARLSILGVEFELSDVVTLFIDPADVVYAMPHLTGAPLSYRQYRATVGLQFGARTVRPLFDPED
jgi:hypothetical protein